MNFVIQLCFCSEFPDSGLTKLRDIYHHLLHGKMYLREEYDPSVEDNWRAQFVEGSTTFLVSLVVPLDRGGGSGGFDEPWSLLGDAVMIMIDRNDPSAFAYASEILQAIQQHCLSLSLKVDPLVSLIVFDDNSCETLAKERELVKKWGCHYAVMSRKCSNDVLLQECVRALLQSYLQRKTPSKRNLRRGKRTTCVLC